MAAIHDPVIDGVKITILRPSSHMFANAGMGSPGAFLTLNMSEATDMNEPSLRGGDVCSLSGILEASDLPRRYYLTPKACAGIIRRAEKRGKELPEQLMRALESVAHRKATATN